MAEITPDWIACDWGLEACRLWPMSAAGEPLAAPRAGAGADRLAAAEFEPALLDAIEDWTLGPATRVVVCGMAGAREGWTEAPLRTVPCLPAGARPVPAPTRDPRLDVAILPGLRQSAPADMMRGEETRIAGFLAHDPAFDGVICLPGRHTRWVRISAGEVVSFQTAITGEMTDLLATRSSLRHAIGREWEEAAFLAALSDTLSRPETVATRPFALASRAALDGGAGAAGLATLSGLLIGAELAATRAHWLGMQVALIGERALCDRYAAALAAQGAPAMRTRLDAVTLRGLVAARRASS